MRQSSRETSNCHESWSCSGQQGQGKATSALTTAEAVRDRFGDDVSFVAVTTTRDPVLVARAVAASFGIADVRVDNRNALELARQRSPPTDLNRQPLLHVAAGAS